jgi:aspartyl-tRNA synthetase
MNGPISKAGAARGLLRLGMPFGEVRAVLEADDARVVHRYLELHRERLEESIVKRRRVLVALERSLLERLEATG